MGARAKLTVRLPREDLDFVKRYAKEHGVTVTDILNRYLTRLREGATHREIHPDIEKISGLVPSDVDAQRHYHEHLLGKHE